MLRVLVGSRCLAASKLTDHYPLPEFHSSARIACLTIGFYVAITKVWHVEQAAKLGLAMFYILDLGTLTAHRRHLSSILKGIKRNIDSSVQNAGL